MAFYCESTTSSPLLVLGNYTSSPLLSPTLIHQLTELVLEKALELLGIHADLRSLGIVEKTVAPDQSHVRREGVGVSILPVLQFCLWGSHTSSKYLHSGEIHGNLHDRRIV